ncbi:cation:proton antiporter [Actinoplanes solisilvae]|uniref:cation:proton antiporter n=1 Tax=Actinoplanes solisilvae TaxID=2486853 RepID=UPI000FDA0D91|nr:cation:proton antiporter [Actinoplanes solisilvae]
MRSLLRIGVFLGVAGLGWAVAALFHVHVTDSPQAYLQAVTVLLAIGLFASVQDIDRGEARRHWRTVLLVITVGVLLKAALIAAVMYAAYREPAYLILGIAVAQIDPLSFAAIGRRDDMSPQARTILGAWASFDDPITVVLTVFLTSWTASSINSGGELPDLAGGLGQFGRTLLLNLIFVAVAGLLWWITKVTVRNATLRNALQIVLVVAAGAVAVVEFLLLGLAVSALFLRPRMGSVLRLSAEGAYLLGTFALGLLLVNGGINPLAGLLLGATAFGAQYVVGSLAAVRRPRRDRRDLAFGQQSGITAVILALFLDESFPGTVGIVAPAILTINVLHLVFKSLRRDRTVATPVEPTPDDPAARRPAGNGAGRPG